MTGTVDGAHTIGRWLTDRAAASPSHTAIDDRGVRIGYADLDDYGRWSNDPQYGALWYPRVAAGWVEPEDEAAIEDAIDEEEA